MLSLLRGAFQRSAKVVKTNKLIVYPGVIIGVSAAAAAATCCFPGNNYNIVIRNQAVEKDEVDEELELEAFREERYRLYRKAFFEPHYTDDGTVVFPPMNGRTVYEMVWDYEDEEEEKKNNNNNNDKKFPPSAPRTRQTSISEIEEKMYDEMRLEIQAKLRGMNTSEFIDYAKREKAKCKEMCEKCKKFPIPLDCDQEEVNKFCGST